MKIAIDIKQLREFIGRAGAATYAGGGAVEENPEREGFIELVYTEGELVYRDSYTGYRRSRGIELVRKNWEPIWASFKPIPRPIS